MNDRECCGRGIDLRFGARAVNPVGTVVDAGGPSFGPGFFQVIAGPCGVESADQLFETARAVRAAGATLLRGGAFKPRTSPYAFQGLAEEGLKLLSAVRAETGLPIVSEILRAEHLELFNDVDVIQVGARNMFNYDLLKELATNTRKPILLKRSFGATVKDWLMSAEYLLSGGNPNVVLCERGIRTFETALRNTCDVGVVPLVKDLCHLPVIVDPSHATGCAAYVPALARAATAAGCDGLIVEVHRDPAHALCDGAQSLTPAAFSEMMRGVKAVRAALEDSVVAPLGGMRKGGLE